LKWQSLEEQLRKYHHAFVIDKSIDRDAYREVVDRTKAELTVAKIERSEAQIEEADIEGILAFAEHVVGNASAPGRMRRLRIASLSSVRCSRRDSSGRATNLEPS
jgi:hypothetical protein